MEIAGQLNNFAYYHHGNTIYCTAEVLEINITDKNNQNLNYFNIIQKGQKINFKYTAQEIENLLPTLLDRIVIITCSSVEQAGPKNGIKYLIDTVKRCGLLLVRK